MTQPIPNNNVNANSVQATNVVAGYQHISNHYYSNGGQERDKARLDEQITSYLKWLRESCGRITLRGIERAGGGPVVELDLDTVYVPLEASVHVSPEDHGLLSRVGNVLKRFKRDKDDEGAALGGHSDTYGLELNRLLALSNRIVVTGGPGCGKTTVLLHMAWALAASLLDTQNDAAKTRLGIEDPALPLPILVPLASFARHRRNLPPTAPAEERTLGKFISSYLIGKDSGIDLPGDFFSRLLGTGQNVILLLDGLDEVANENERALVRESVESLMSGKEQLRAIVTCRTIAYKSQGTALGASFKEVMVKPIDYKLHVTPMVQQAYGCIFPSDEGQRSARTADLLHGITQLEQDRRARLGDDALMLVDTPLMVRLLLIVHYNERKLPDERAKLFEKAINALIQVDYGREEEVRQTLAANWEMRREMSQHLAFHMHQQGRDQGREIDEPVLKASLKSEPEFLSHIDDFLSHIRNRGGLLEERDGAYRFIHLAFQEFLAARYLREVKGGEGLPAIVQFLEEDKLSASWWREPILLLAGYMSGTAPKNAREFLRRLTQAGRTPDDQLAAAELAGMAALEWKDSGDVLRQELLARLESLIEDTPSMTRASPGARVRAGRTLGRLGDPRHYVTEVDAMRFCRVPRGRFAMGSAKDNKDAWDNEKPAQMDFMIDYDYLIGQHPASNAQFEQFVREEGYANPRWWAVARQAGVWEAGQVKRRVYYYEDEAQKKWGERYEAGDRPKRFGEPFDLPNHPVVGITWYEALAFCDWLTARWRDMGQLKQNQRVRLPNEPEWEKAARGGDVLPLDLPVAATVAEWPTQPTHWRKAMPMLRQYPYGDAFDANAANTEATQINTTSALGVFPVGIGPYGCYDMSGNVLEWTSSAYGSRTLKDGKLNTDLKYGYPYRAEDGRENLYLDRDMARAVRGGSWSNSARDARCACRGWLTPDYRNYDLGVRIVVSPISSLTPLGPVASGR